MSSYTSHRNSNVSTTSSMSSTSTFSSLGKHSAQTSSIMHKDGAIRSFVSRTIGKARTQVSHLPEGTQPLVEIKTPAEEQQAKLKQAIERRLRQDEQRRRDMKAMAAASRSSHMVKNLY